MIKLIDLIELAGIKLRDSDFKIHCATSPTESLGPLDAFYAGKFKEWQANQTKKNFECKYILSLIYLGNGKWLFAGVYEVVGVSEWAKDHSYWVYPTQELSGLEHLTAKAIVLFKKTFRASYLIGMKYINDLLIAELRPEPMTIGDFPGYKSILLSYYNLQTIINESNPSWKSALSNVAGVYLITDKSDGKLYVGSAYGNRGGIWQRWVVYAKNGHGGNKELKSILDKNDNHKGNFQFSLLEVCDVDSKPKDVIKKESHWKNVLQTQKFGLTNN